MESVFGEVGCAQTATDPASLEILAPVVRLRSENAWRDFENAGKRLFRHH